MITRTSLPLLLLIATAQVYAEPWQRHTIDNSSQGADGVRVADVNGDGLMDLTTGWEEGGLIRVYINPGAARAKQPWPAVTVGKVKSPEDAVFADLDQDGAIDVISSCEGKTRKVFVHWAPTNLDDYLSRDAWRTDKVPCADNGQMWMFCLPMQIDGQFGMDLVVGSKGENASVGWLQAPSDARKMSEWKYHRLYDAGWIMSLLARDMDSDGDEDIVISDRKGANRGVLWLEHPSNDLAHNASQWKTHRLGAADREVMFLAVGRDDSDNPGSIFATCRNDSIAKLSPPNWELSEIPMPSNTGTGKGIAVTDINLDGRTDIAFTCENANGSKSGVRWLSRTASGNWKDHEISGPEGIKFDRIEMMDLDQDGDLDLVTCEERANLGVIWYENPTR